MGVSFRFRIGQKVFAKFHGYPAWPGIICEVLRKYSGPSKTTSIYSVYLYEIGIYVKLSASKLQDYEEYVQENSNYLTSCLMLATAIKICMQHHATVTDENGFILPVKLLGRGSPNYNKLTEEFKAANKTEKFTEEKSYDENLAIEYNRTLLSKVVQMTRMEVKLLEYDFQIKLNLSIYGVSNSYCMQVIKVLNKIFELPLNECILKKCPEIVTTVLRLRSYKGNTSRWRMTRKEKRLFQMNARKIRKKAFNIYNVFRKIFNVPAEISFTKIYQSELKRACISKK